jgi:hypothetical protein
MSPARTVERVQTGVRLERRILGMLKAIADMHGMTLGDLLEGMALHAFEGKPPFGAETLARIRSLRDAFALDLTAADAHGLVEASSRRLVSRRPSRGGRRDPGHSRRG